MPSETRVFDGLIAAKITEDGEVLIGRVDQVEGPLQLRALYGPKRYWYGVGLRPWDDVSRKALGEALRWAGSTLRKDADGKATK